MDKILEIIRGEEDMAKLQAGNIYKLTRKVRQDGKVIAVHREMKLVELYKHHAVFLVTAGYKVSFTYFDLKLMLNGIAVNKTWRRE